MRPLAQEDAVSQQELGVLFTSFQTNTPRMGCLRSSRSGLGSSAARITVADLTMAYGNFVIQRDLTLSIQPGEIFIIMDGSGCGKSTLLRHLIGLLQPAKGHVLYDGESFWATTPEARERMMRRFGVLYQSGALWSSMTLAENVALRYRA